MNECGWLLTICFVPGCSAWVFTRMSLLIWLYSCIPLHQYFIHICPFHMWWFSHSAKMQEFRCLRDCSFSYCWTLRPKNSSHIPSKCGGTLGNVPSIKGNSGRDTLSIFKYMAVTTSVPVLTDEVLFAEYRDKWKGPMIVDEPHYIFLYL